jgi:hypothetical protein
MKKSKLSKKNISSFFNLKKGKNILHKKIEKKISQHFYAKIRQKSSNYGFLCCFSISFLANAKTFKKKQNQFFFSEKKR